MEGSQRQDAHRGASRQSGGKLQGQRNEKFEPTLAEYLKLVQLEKEFEEDEVKEIKIKWVEPSARARKKSK